MELSDCVNDPVLQAHELNGAFPQVKRLKTLKRLAWHERLVLQLQTQPRSVSA